MGCAKDVRVGYEKKWDRRASQSGKWIAQRYRIKEAEQVKKTSAIFVWWEGMGQVRWKRLAGATIPLRGMYPEKTIIQKGSCTAMFIAAILTIARTWKYSVY